MKDEALGEELSFVNHGPSEKDEELPRLFAELARISKKLDVNISLHITFGKGKEIAKCDGKGRGLD